MKTYNIGISCIGSGVGQSVINSCRLSGLPLKTIGFGTNPLAYGLYDCDEYDYTPPIYQSDYIEKLIEACIKHKIDLLIPGLDDEALYISRSIAQFDRAGINVIVAGEELLNICRDKEKMSNDLGKISDIFVKSYSKEDFIALVDEGKIDLPVIAKPRDGFASRGIEIITNKDQIFKVTDAHIVQELAVPHALDPEREFYLRQLNRNINPQVAEISIQLVAGPRGEIIGKMISYNKLNNGVPIEIIPFEDKMIWEEVFKLYPTLKSLGLRGPFNLQGRLTDKGLKLFELQARFTGITGLRAYMGFNEVEACIRQWLNIDVEKASLRLNYNRFGIRQTADKSLSIDLNKEVRELYLHLNKEQIKKKKTILITGATGYLGRNLIKSLIIDSDFEIWAFVRDKDKARSVLSSEVELFDSQDIGNGNLSFGNIDILLHAGFARPHCSNEEIGQSLHFTNDLFRRAVLNQIPAIINISSQSVYGQGSIPPWNENSPVVPVSTYAMAKYATELSLNNLAYINNHISYTSIRLGALTGGLEGLVFTDLCSKFAMQALKGEDILINGGKQQVQRLDVRDAISGLRLLLDSNPVNWRKVYNLGADHPHNIVDVAIATAKLAGKYNGGIESKVIVNESDLDMKFGLDSSLFKSETNWIPAHNLDSTIDSLLEYCYLNGKSDELR